MPFDPRRAAVVTAGFAAFLNLYPPQALLPQLEQAFAVGSGGATITVAAGPLSVALLAPFAGIVTDIVGRARMMAIAMTGLGLATILSGTANSLGEMLFWRFACGLFVPGIVAAAAGSLGDDPDPRHAARAAGQYIAGTVLGGFSGRFLAGFATEYLGWRAAFYVIGGLTLSLLPLVIPGMRLAAGAPHLPPRPRDAVRAGLSHLCNRRLLAAFAIGFGLLFSLVATFTYAALHLAAPPYSLSPAAIGSIFAAYLVGVVLTPFTGRWVAAHGRSKVATVGMAFAMLGILLTLLGGAPVIITGLAVSCGGIFMLQALATGFVPTAAIQAKSAAVGLYTSAYYFGGSVGAIAPSLVWQHFGWPGCVGFILVAHLALLLVARRLWRTHPLPE
jgi:predicted MFS family arabinose efflux permease